MDTTMKRVAFGGLAVLLTFGAMADDPQISSVTVRQRWPWSKLVDIDYVLTADSTQNVGIAVQAYDGDTLLTLPSTSLTGDLYSVPRGMRRIVWDPTRTAYTNNRALTRFSVQLAPTNAATYLIVDLSSGDISTFDSGASLMADATNNIYKTTKLLLRRVPAGTYTMGVTTNASRSRQVALAKDFYIGVYEVTRTQWGKVMGTPGVTGTLSIRGPSYYDIRETVGENVTKTGTLNGASGSAITPSWPQSSDVGSASFVGLLRAKTNRTGFDLPTSAQWEYACRAGTATDFNNGQNMATNPATGFDLTLGTLAWYAENTPNNASIVGSKLPNSWGLYDMHGDLYEWCLDWYSDVNNPTKANFSTTAETDPSGPSSGSARVWRGGDYSQQATACASWYLGQDTPSRTYWTTGFRVVLTLE